MSRPIIINPASVLIIAIILTFSTQVAGQTTSTYGYSPQPTPVFETEITVTATGAPTAVEDIPVPTTVISRQKMDDSAEVHVADLEKELESLLSK